VKDILVINVIKNKYFIIEGEEYTLKQIIERFTFRKKQIIHIKTYEDKNILLEMFIIYKNKKHLYKILKKSLKAHVLY
jgi:hypothetical protein